MTVTTTVIFGTGSEVLTLFMEVGRYTIKFLKSWWARQGLNLRPHPCEGWECEQLRLSADEKTEENGHC